MRVTILGVGLIGGSIGLAARRRLDAHVVGFDPDRTTADWALRNEVLDSAPDSVAEACEGAELIFCAAPVSVLPELAREALAACGEECVVTDVGSTKREIVAALGQDERFIGGHPLAGAETSGVENARAELLDGARWYLTPTTYSGGLLYDRLQRALAELGARPQAIDADTHDRLMATVSHLPHVIANVLVTQAASELAAGSEQLPEAGPSLRDTTRVAGANPEIWGDIFDSNREAVAAAIDATVKRLQRASALILEGDREAVAGWHQRAAEDRRQLLEAELAGGPLQQLRVGVPNRPGTVAELALALGRAGVNIEDMALSPSADMRSGAISLWIAGEEEAARAVELVRELGYTVSVEPG
ncbi:MAG: prephenate dehydrogenase/arogenate dehydrogenase family protein [Actinomycetota bacterium]|nr:prephenate dehydrogenase/arogenate dehydrogenase family protein [Actinomycetota bacterium]